MKKIDIAKSIIKNNGGIIKTVQLNKAGIQNSEIKKMCESGENRKSQTWILSDSRSSGNIRGEDDSNVLGRGNCMYGICVVLLWL